jgi:DNA-binding NtrC family response regulator
MKKGSKKILIVDDDELLLDAMSQMLFQMGYSVTTAKNGEQGFGLFMRKQCDIVLTDFDMPGLDGISLAFHIKGISPDTAVILMTGHDRASIMRLIRHSAVDLALFKPFDLLTLEKTLHQTQTRREQKLRSSYY